MNVSTSGWYLGNAEINTYIWNIIYQAPVAEKVDNEMHRINRYRLDSAIGVRNSYGLDNDLSDG